VTFAYVEPETVADAVAELAIGGDTIALAGGTAVTLLLKQ
jgi:CO/xanthine dehydrogenase FAD-binding subunit